MLRMVVRLVGVVLLAGAAWAAWSAFSGPSGTAAEFKPPGSVDVELEEGKYDIVLDTQLAGDDQCDPADHFGEIRRMRLELVPEDGAAIEPTRRDSCLTSEDPVDGSDFTIAVSYFEVEEAGDYELRGAKQLTPPARPATVTLESGGSHWGYLVGAAIAAVFGLGLLGGGRGSWFESSDPGSHHHHDPGVHHD